MSLASRCVDTVAGNHDVGEIRLTDQRLRAAHRPPTARLYQEGSGLPVVDVHVGDHLTLAVLVLERAVEAFHDSVVYGASLSVRTR